jgi:DNA (cytosine-5)-methyltransferase 1
MELTFGSLFAGIGGFDLGFERAGMTCKWQVEIDPFCRAVLAKHWPSVKRYEDVRDVGTHNLEQVDVICGGFPCQDISLAGDGIGIDGPRSGLWREFDRIIGALRPRYVVVENVSALLGRGMGRVLGDLAARGYDAEWDCLPAACFGAPHRRDRLWIVAYANGPRRGTQRQPCAVVERWEGRPRPDVGRPDVAHANQSGLEGRYGGGVSECATKRATGPSGPQVFTERPNGQWEPEPAVGRVAHGVPRRVDRLRGLGNAVVPQITQWIGERLMEASQ